MKHSHELQALEATGLSQKEAETFLTLLRTGSQTATGAARTVGRPRTSVLIELENLHKKGFIERIKVGGHFEWEASELDEIESSVSEKIDVFKKVLPSLREMAQTQSFGKKFSVKLFSGASGFMKAYHRVLELPRGERVYIFEGLQSVKDKLVMREQMLIKWQQRFRDSGIVIEVLGSASIPHEVHRRKGFETVRAHLDRTIIGYALPEAFADFPCDIAVLPNTIILLIANKELAVVIDSTELASTLRVLFEGLKTISQKVDVNKLYEDLSA